MWAPSLDDASLSAPLFVFLLFFSSSFSSCRAVSLSSVCHCGISFRSMQKAHPTKRRALIELTVVWQANDRQLWLILCHVVWCSCLISEYSVHSLWINEERPTNQRFLDHRHGCRLIQGISMNLVASNSHKSSLRGERARDGERERDANGAERESET